MNNLYIDTIQISVKMYSMKWYKRAIEKEVKSYLGSQNNNKILFIWGPRRSGKTTLLKKISKEIKETIFNFDYQSDQDKFVPRREDLEKLVQAHKVILIDEVQNFSTATVVLKLLHDEFGVKIIATGSSELRQKGESFDSLAGRYQDLYCLPFSTFEIADDTAVLAEDLNVWKSNLQKQLQIFGAYPEVFAGGLSEKSKIDLLEKIVETYVLKDIISIYDLKSVKLAKDILIKIALQIGSEVSLREIANSLSANVATVSNYIEILIKNYIVIPLLSFKTNRRKAVSGNRKLYFYDLGIRNALVSDFRDLRLRPDRGGVFENFIVSELEKRRKILGKKLNLAFYREYGGKEVDLVVENYKKKYFTAEIKVNRGKSRDIFPLPHKFTIINDGNYFEKIKLLV